MVNAKIVMAAVVLIVAVPILLGYGMSFQDVEKTTWNTGVEKNVTNYLYNDTEYSPVSIDSYSLNSMVLKDQISTLIPQYKTFGDEKTNVPYTRTTWTAPIAFEANQYNYSVYIDPVSTPIRADFNHINNSSFTLYVLSCVYDAANHTISGYHVSGGTVSAYSYPAAPGGNNWDPIVTFQEGSVTINTLLTQPYSNNKYANLVDGWTIPAIPSYNGSPVGGQYAYAPNTANGSPYNDIILSINLGSFVGTASYTVDYSNGADPQSVTIESQQVAGVHTLTAYLNNHENEQTIYMSLANNVPSADHNWYQLRASSNGIILSYVGDIGSTFGAYQAYDDASWSFSTPKDSYSIYGIYLPDNTTITYRGEYAIQKGFDYPIIKNNSYTPKSFSGDSSEVTISQIYRYGSFEWGGETVTIDSNGSYLVEGRRSNVDKGIVLKTLYEDSTYTNYINGREVSQTSTAPVLNFNGAWDCTVKSTTLTSETSTSSEWVPGEFAWNGVDTSFALMGLITSVGVFVGLGMYGARSGAKVGMLMLICGGAALIFLALI